MEGFARLVALEPLPIINITMRIVYVKQHVFAGFKMPYIKFKSGDRYAIKNTRTGNITRYHSAEARETGIRVREAYSHGWKPKGLARASRATRTKVARMGGRARRR